MKFLFSGLSKFLRVVAFVHSGLIKNVMPTTIKSVRTKDKSITYNITVLKDLSDQELGLCIVDSGAHTIQSLGAITDQALNKHLKIYKHLIEKCPDYWHYVELDVDSHTDIPYARTKKIYEELKEVNPNIIRVWHVNRGIEEWERYVSEEAENGGIIGFSGLEFIPFKTIQGMVHYAVQRDVRVHGFGCGRQKMLEAVPLYSADLSSWAQWGLYGRIVKPDMFHRQKSLHINDEDVHKLPVNAIDVFLKGQEGRFNDSYHVRSMEHHIQNYLRLETFITKLWEERGVTWDE